MIPQFVVVRKRDREYYNEDKADMGIGLLQALMELCLKEGKIGCFGGYEKTLRKYMGAFLSDSLTILRDEVDRYPRSIETAVNCTIRHIDALACERFNIKDVQDKSDCVDRRTLLPCVCYVMAWLLNAYNTTAAKDVSSFLKAGANFYLGAISGLYAWRFEFHLNYYFSSSAFDYMGEFAMQKPDHFNEAVAGFGETTEQTLTAIPAEAAPESGGGRQKQLSLEAHANNTNPNKKKAKDKPKPEKFADLFVTDSFKSWYQSSLRTHMERDKDGCTPDAEDVIDINLVFDDNFKKRDLYKSLHGLYYSFKPCYYLKDMFEYISAHSNQFTYSAIKSGYNRYQMANKNK